jgi:hypothetical protein
MKLGPIVLLLRLADTRFHNLIGGAVDMETATRYTLKNEAAFVIPLDEDSPDNGYDNIINQILTERFGIVVAIKNDAYQEDKTGLSAHDQLHDVRNEIFKAILGRDFATSESIIYYRGGQLMVVNGGWLWYMFKFEFKSRLLTTVDGIVHSGLSTKEVLSINTVEEADPDNENSPLNPNNNSGMDAQGNIDPNSLPTLDRMYIQYLNGKDIRLYDGTLGDIPIKDGFPDVTIPDIGQWIDFTENPNAGAFWRAFSDAFKRFEE